jgi:hypothetical protein
VHADGILASLIIDPNETEKGHVDCYNWLHVRGSFCIVGHGTIAW